MTTYTSADLANQIAQVNFNPAEIHRLLLKRIQDNSNGEVTLFNPTTPVVAGMEAGILTATSVLQEFRAITRSLYPATVDNWDDLYVHMQDVDFKDLLAQPGTATLNFFMSIDEIKQKAIPVENATGVSMLQIPRHTQITVGDYTLMLKYPIIIKINSYGNIAIKYDVSVGEVLGSVSDALINFRYTKINDIELISFSLEVIQVALQSGVYAVTQNTGFVQKIKTTDNLYLVKAYTRLNTNSQWFEVDVTPRIKGLNKNQATVQVQEGTGYITVKIPPYYLVNNMLGTELRLDIYTTKGLSNHNLANYDEASYKFSFFDYNNKNNAYSGIMGGLNVFKCYSADTIEGGRDRLDFDTAKNRVVNRSTITEGVPITDLELNNRLSDLGMSTTRVLDNVSDLTFAASKLIPAPTNNLTVTGVGCNVQTMQARVEDLAKLTTVRDNGDRITVLPNTLYNVVNGVLTVVDNATVRTMIDPAVTSPDQLATWANNNNLVFSPYYYIHDVSNNLYSVRPYRLDNPNVLGKESINENTTLQLDASVYSYQITPRSDLQGYTLHVGLIVGDTFKELSLNNVSIQLSYTNDTDTARYYIDGVLDVAIDATTGRPIGDNYVYRFDFLTNWDIDDSHRLIMANSFIPIPLQCELDVFIVVKDFKPTGFSKTAMDNLINVASMSNYDGGDDHAVLTQERLTVKFGTYMSNLWNRCRSAPTADNYKVYPADVPLTFTDNVYQRDQNGVIEFTKDATTGVLSPVLINKIGDPVLVNGVAQTKHKMGDIMLDQDGNPVLKDGLRGLTRQFDMVVMDGLYYLTTHQLTIEYFKQVLDTIDDWVFNILRDRVSPELLGRSTILYHPKSTVGTIKVYVENGITALVQADQQLSIKLYVGDSVYNNNDLRDSYSQTAKKVIQNLFETQDTISVSDMVNVVSDNLGENVFGVDIAGFMGDKYSTITVYDNLTTPCIGKKMTVNSKLELVVSDSVDIEFIWHSRRSGS